jgi:hypothetical protein
MCSLMTSVRTVDSVVPALLYPQRPSDETVEQLEAIALPKGIMVVFFDDMDWRADHPEMRTDPEMMLASGARCPLAGGSPDAEEFGKLTLGVAP